MIRRGLVALAVLSSMSLALAVLIYSSNAVPPRALDDRARADHVVPLHFPKKPEPHPPQLIEPELPLPIITEPITIPPLRIERPMAPPPNEGLLGVGRSLACARRAMESAHADAAEQCLRRPWHFVKRGRTA